MRKVEALSAYRSQFPLEPGMFPEFVLQEIFGCEYFVAAPSAASSTTRARCASPARTDGDLTAGSG